MTSLSGEGETDLVSFAILRPLEAVAFWSAIALPFLYLPLLVRGLETSGELLTFFTLLTLNAVAIILGHGHRRA